MMPIGGIKRWPLTALAVLTATGCASSGKLDIRPVGKQASLAGQPVSARIALAQGQLALGNVALALEEFRRSEREAPNSVAALSGMAECYRQMGRLELTHRYYEQALAIAPDDPALYAALAAALDQDGKSEAARALRMELTIRLAGKALPVVTAAGSVAQLPKASGDRPAGSSVTVLLPPPLAATPVLAATRVRLERMSSGEVALVSGERSPFPVRQAAARPRPAPRATAVARATATVEPMVVLNAARIAGSAARTRDFLARRGLGPGAIGDAPATRAQSLILYPRSELPRARRIAAQFPFATQLKARPGPLTLIIGRNAAAKDAATRYARRIG
jgi:hypothetical protein